MPSTPLARFLLGLLLGLMGSVCAFAQAAAEYGSVTSKAAAAAAKAKPLAPAPAQPPSAHLPVQSSESAATANCRALKERAGPDAARLALRSVPDHAQVWIDTMFVGATPLDLTVAPGTHQLEVRGVGMESSRQKVELLPKQSLQVTVSLKPYYRNKISLP